ncbi:MAG: MogA/MoaB family molybdenum cofactor biosynthesis protein [Thermodesulfobacteriota bacterium]
MGTAEHKQNPPAALSIGILTVSTTRTLETDASGQWIKQFAKKEGHVIAVHRVIPDDSGVIAATVQDITAVLSPQVLILTGGTGISPKDLTIEAVRPCFQKELTAFGPIFAQLSYEEIDSAALLSRATAGIIGHTVVFCIPGSLGACKLACKALIFPELAHLVRHMGE